MIKLNTVPLFPYTHNFNRGQIIQAKTFTKGFFALVYFSPVGKSAAP